MKGGGVGRKIIDPVRRKNCAFARAAVDPGPMNRITMIP